MFQNSKLIYSKMVKESDLFISNYQAYTVAEAQTIYDAYITAGYTLYDASVNHSLDVSGEAATDIIIAWKSGVQLRTEYQVKASYFTGKNVVIMGVKLDGSDHVTSANIRVHLTSWEGVTSSWPIALKGLEIHLRGRGGNLTITGLSVSNCIVYNHAYTEITASIVDNTEWHNYNYLKLTTTGGSQTARVENESGSIGSINTYTFPASVTKALDWGNYIAAYCSNGKIYFYDKDTKTVDAGTTIANSVIDMVVGKYLYIEKYQGTNTVFDYVSDDGSALTVNASALVLTGIRNGSNIVSDGDYCYVGFTLNNNLYKFVTTSETTLDLSQATNYLSYYAGYVYSSKTSTTGNCKQVRCSDYTITKTIAASSGVSNYMTLSDNVYTIRKWLSVGGSSYIQKTLIADDTNQTINASSGETYSGITPFAFDGKYAWFYRPNNGIYEIYKMTVSEFTFNYVCSIAFVPTNLGIVRGCTLIPNGVYVREVRLYAQEESHNFAHKDMPDPAIIDASDYLEEGLDSIDTRYSKPDAANSKTRQYYVTNYSPAISLSASLKKFCSGRRKVVRRYDAELFLAVAGSEKKIINLELFDNDGTTPYDFSGLPSDENLLIYALNGTEVAYFIWFNEKLYKTYYTKPSATSTYTIKCVFQLWKLNGTDANIAQVEGNDAAGPLKGSPEWNNEDNEIVDVIS